MNDEIKEILNIIECWKSGDYVLAYSFNYDRASKQNDKLLDYITNLQQENERLKQNQVNALNRIRDFINTSKCEILEGSYCNDKHSQYWKMFIQFAEELKKKIKGLDTKDYVYIPKWREQELLRQEQLEDLYNQLLKDYDELQIRIEKAVEYLKNNCFIGNDCIAYEEIDIVNVMNILKGVMNK